MKSLDIYIEKAPYMSNAIISQLDTVESLDELCDLIGSFLPVDYTKKKTVCDDNFSYRTCSYDLLKICMKR